MKIAWITHAPTASGHGGGATYNRAVYRLLSSMPGPCEVIEIPLRDTSPRMPHRLRQALSFARAAFSTYPAKAMFYMPPGILPRLAAHLTAAGPDLVVISSTDLLFCRAATDGIPTAVVAHNVEQALYANQVETAARRFPPAGPILRADLRKLQEMETDGLTAADLIVAISTEDAAWFERHGITTPVFILPPTFPGPLPDHSRPPARRPLRLAFVAKLSWWPNRIGCNWLIRGVLAKLPPGVAELNIYGPGSENMNNPAAGITGHGFVDRLEDVWSNNHIAVCPIDQGSGVNVKFVESLVNGMPILTTSFGGRGLPPTDRDPAIRICDGARAWIDFLLSDEAELLAGLTPAEDTRRLFLDETYREPFAKAIAQAGNGRRNQSE